MCLPTTKMIFPSSPEVIENGTAELLNTYDEWYRVLASKTFTSKTDFFEYCELTEKMDFELECYEFMQYVHPDKLVRTASAEASKKVAIFSNKWGMNTDVFKSMLTFYDTYKDVLNYEEKLYLERTIDGYKHNGIHLDDNTRSKLENINKELSDLSITYNTNLSDVNDFIEVTEEQLQGVEKDFIDTLEKTDDGFYKITTKYDHINKIMPYCDIEDTRKKLSVLFLHRGKEPYKNHELLQQTLGLRAQKVKLLGYNNYANYTLSHRRMATSLQHVNEFLYDLVDKIKVIAHQDVDKLSTFFNKTQMESWNLSYYSNLYKKQMLQLDQQEIQKYFPLEKLLPKLLGTFEEIFHLRIQEVDVSSNQIWHESVKCYCVYDNKDNISTSSTDVLDISGVIGHFYIDLYPREGKYGHAAAFTLKPAYIVNGIRSTPISAMVCNFTRPTSTKPSLLTFREVVTFFHELGHIFHQLLSRNRFSRFSGSAVERDFVECPSQALENWCYEADFLTRISSHYETGISMPINMMEKIKENKQLFNGIHYIRQLIFAIYDMELHSSDNNNIHNVEDTFNDIQNKLSPMVHCDGCMAANFGHLMGGYGSGYYGYLWSKVYATEVFELFKNSGNIFNREIGLHYRQCILEKGGTQTGFTMMENLLGRTPNNKAFLNNLSQ